MYLVGNGLEFTTRPSVLSQKNLQAVEKTCLRPLKSFTFYVEEESSQPTDRFTGLA